MQRKIITLKKSNSSQQNSNSITILSTNKNPTKPNIKISPYYPKQYSKYKSLIKEKSFNNAKAKKTIERFLSRFRLANVFDGIKIKNDDVYFSSIQSGYEASIKFFLAFTAYEEIVSCAVLLKIGSHGYNRKPLQEPSLQKVKGNLKLKKLLLMNEKNKDEMQASLEKFYTTSSSNIIPFCYGIRNSFAHGELTAMGSGSSRGKSIPMESQDLFILATALLEYSETVFDKCIALLK